MSAANLSPVQKAVGSALFTAVSSGVFALVGKCSSVTKPSTAAVFGASFALTLLENPLTSHKMGVSGALSARITNVICDYTGIRKNDPRAQSIYKAFWLFLSASASWAVCNALKRPITFRAATLLTAATVATVWTAEIVNKKIQKS